MNEILNKAIEVNGVDYQMNVAIEELSELQKEICKMKRGIGSNLNLAEEMADVEIVLEELKMIYNNRDMVEVYKKRKVERLAERLGY